MIDIEFYQKFSKLKRDMLEKKQDLSKDELFNILEEYRSNEPVLYDIETTNLCNMNCVMCPGPTQMTRPRVHLPMDLFNKAIGQIRPFSNSEISKWESFAEKYYGIKRKGMSENHWFLYVIPRVLVLHGYGDPLLDPYIVERVNNCTELDIPTYFSCNVWNLKDIGVGEELLDAGLDYIKFHTDSSDDFSIKQIRGSRADFSDSFDKINELIKIKEDNGYKTTIVITMLDLNRKNQLKDYKKLVERFSGLDVYIYLKSQDQLWFNETGAEMKAIHWLEPCQFPWTSMSVKSNGECCQCSEDFNNEIILGDISNNDLVDIWNGDLYKQFRWDHINMDKNIKCTKTCDMPLMGEFIK